MRGIHRWPVNSPHKGPVTRKMFPFDDVIMTKFVISNEGKNVSASLDKIAFADMVMTKCWSRFYPWLCKVSANERRLYIFYHLLKPWSAVERKRDHVRGLQLVRGHWWLTMVTWDLYCYHLPYLFYDIGPCINQSWAKLDWGKVMAFSRLEWDSCIVGII